MRMGLEVGANEGWEAREVNFLYIPLVESFFVDMKISSVPSPSTRSHFPFSKRNANESCVGVKRRG